jgi:preprotein translocase subunit SecG
VAMMDSLLVYYLLYSTIKVEVGEGTMKSDKVDLGDDEPKVQLEVEVGIGVLGLEGSSNNQNKKYTKRTFVHIHETFRTTNIFSTLFIIIPLIVKYQSSLSRRTEKKQNIKSKSKSTQTRHVTHSQFIAFIIIFT